MVEVNEARRVPPARIQGMVRSIDQYRNGDPKAVADGSYAQVLYALTDYKHDVLVLWDFAVEAARQAEALQRENADLRAFAASFKFTCVEVSFYKDCYLHIIEPDSVSFRLNNGSQFSQFVAKLEDRRARALLGGENAGNGRDVEGTSTRTQNP